MVSISAGVFLLIALGGYFYHRGQLAEIAAEHLRLMVTGPARISIGVAQRYTARTTTVTGHPVPAQVEFLLHGPDGQQLMAHKEAADEQGEVHVTVEADSRWPPQVRMEVVGSYSIRTERVETQLAVEPAGYLTALCLDQPCYRPGETLRYRSLTASRFSLAADRQLPIRCEVRAPNGSLVPDSVREGITVKGLGWGEFRIPNDLPEGAYAVHAISLDLAFPEVSRPFAVRADRPTGLKLDIEFFRDRYAPGDKVIADFSCRRLDGSPAAKVRVKAVATILDKIVHEAAGETSTDGLFRIAFALPDRLEQPVGQVRIAVEDGKARDATVRPIPISSGGVRVVFRPEGGDLVAGMENRLYFSARDGAGKPVRVSGRIVDGQDRSVATVETTHEGMGSVQFEPQAAQQYRLKVDPPSDGQAEIKLPPVSGNHSVVLTTGLGVIEPGTPLEFNVRAAAADLPLLAVVSCRGIEVGQQTLVTSLGANTVTVPLHEDAAGALRLTLYEYRSSPPKLLAERLIYRRPHKRLEVQAVLEGQSLRPGQGIDLPLRVTDEQGQPAPADLSIAAFVVPPLGGMPPEGGTTNGRAAPRLHPNPEDPGGMDSLAATVPVFPGSLSQFLLLGELESPQTIENLESYLSADRKAPAALDLVLGVFARRRPVAGEGAAGASAPAGAGEGAAEAGLGCPPPIMFDNLQQLLERYQSSLVSYRVNRTRVLNAMTTLSFFGGIGLVVFVAMLSLLNIPCSLRLWGAALGVAAACIVIGAVLMDPERLKRHPGGEVPFTPYEAPPTPRPSPPGDIAGAAAKRQKLAAFPALAGDGRSPANLVWRPLVSTDQQGRASVRVEFAARAASYRILLDAHAESGRIGASSIPLNCPMPFRLEPHVPAGVGVGDRMDMPVGVVNDSDQRLSIQLAVEHGPSVRMEGSPKRTLELAPRQRIDEYFTLHALGPQGGCPLAFRAQSGGLASAVERPILIHAAGYPAEWSSSGRIEGREEVIVRVPDDVLPGSLDAQLRLFPSFAADVQTAMDALAEQPTVGLDQAEALAGTGALVLRELASDGPADPVLIRRAKQWVGAAESSQSKGAGPSRGHDPLGSKETADPQILKHRSASGAFGGPRATLLALTALAADVRRARAVSREGKCVIQRAREVGRVANPSHGEAGRVGNPSYVVVAEQTIPAGQRATVTIVGWQDKLLPGENRLAVELAGAGSMPYLLAVRYRTVKPPSDPACPVRLSAKLAQAKVKIGQTVPVEVQWVNVTDRELPAAVAIVGLPAGMEVRLERLEALRRSGGLDAYQVRTSDVVCYWRSIPPKKTAIVQLDLAAVVPGKFTAPASRVYLHDTPEQKHWVEPLAVEITRD